MKLNNLNKLDRYLLYRYSLQIKYSEIIFLCYRHGISHAISLNRLKLKLFLFPMIKLIYVMETTSNNKDFIMKGDK